MTRYQLGTTVYTNDNVNIGTIDRLIVDPRTEELQGFVVRKGRILERDVVIPAGDVAPDTFDDMYGVIHLTIAQKDTDRLLAYQEKSYAEPPVATEHAVDLLWPAPVYHPAPGAKPRPEEVHAARARIAETHPASAILHTGTKIVGRHGVQIGTVGELLANQRTGAISELIAKRGPLDASEVRIPVQLIEYVTDDAIYVAIDQNRMEQFTYP